MRERRVEILRNLVAAQGFLSVASGHRGASPPALVILREARAQTLVADPEKRIPVTA
jgi:hypothetical protein